MKHRVIKFSGKLACHGFTLIELMIVIAIVGTLSALAVPNYLSYRERAKMSTAVSDIHALEQDITRYLIDNGQLPNSLADIGRENFLDPWNRPYQYLRIDCSSADKVVEDKKDKSKKDDNCVKGVGKMRKDHNLVPVNSDYDLYSLGKDGKSASPFTAKISRDDIVRANDGKYIGPVSGY